ncbi:hypothetical protein EV702DRAFT_1190794 [Suillus placidus]|uniref:Uncharacterized protein n=1 Tax=Suillus placidus TaxID=48579 RepID=A0A9P7A7M6_9AGAM|nr:hypothetical protein EV702DRAFT_1190794 [Suillus placidus]
MHIARIYLPHGHKWSIKNSVAAYSSSDASTCASRHSKVTKRFTQSAQQSPNPECTGAHSRAQIASTPELNIEQASNPGVAKAEQPDRNFVNERITDATSIFAGIGNVSG